MYKLHTTCRACGNRDLIPVLDLGVQPLANNFVRPEEQRHGFAPLSVLFCDRCTLGQLSVVVNPEILYSNYAYRSSDSITMRRHWESMLAFIKRWSPAKQVLEIGSNDGALLKWLRDNNGSDVLGIDPAENLAPPDTIVAPFDQHSARTAVKLIEPDTIIARHVMAHIDDWQEFVRGLDIVCSDTTRVFIEVPTARSLIDRCEFDTIYHEHLSYVTVESIEQLLRDSPFYLMHVEPVTVHGGSMIMVLGKGHPVQLPPSDIRVCWDDWIGLQQKAWERIECLQTFVDHLGSVSGYTAPAKATVWINAAQFTHEQIDFVCDCTPEKQGAFIPGTMIPVVPEDQVAAAKHLIIFAWNYQDEILSKLKPWREAGGRVIGLNPDIQLL